MKRRGFAAIALILTVAVAGCGGDDSKSGAGNGSSDPYFATCDDFKKDAEKKAEVVTDIASRVEGTIVNGTIESTREPTARLKLDEYCAKEEGDKQPVAPVLKETEAELKKTEAQP